MENHIYTQLGFASVQYETVKSTYSTIAQTIFTAVVNQPKVTDLMAKATATDDKNAHAELRQALYSTLKPLYDNLSRQNVRQLHFHLPGAISFLRFHRPNKFGDDLSAIRPSIVNVNQTYQPSYGFEEGRIFNGFRHVFPLFHEGRFVGSVEISYPFSAIQTMLMKLQPAHYHFILDKNIIDGKVWKDELQNYKITDLHPSYYYGLSVNDHHSGTEYIDERTISLINDALTNKVNQQMLKHENFSKYVKIANQWYIVHFLNVTNYLHQPAGYFITYTKDNTIVELVTSFRQQLLVLLAGGLITITLLVLYWRSLQHKHFTLKTMAMSDPLTGLANRANFIAVLQNSIRFAKRTHTPLSIIFFDIDHFKAINDNFGHDMGDEILIEVSNLVTSRIRESDLFARWGGEEFAIILPQTTLDDAMDLAENLRSTIEGYSFAHGKLTCSFGVTRLHEEDTDALLMKRVDTMLYSAKQHGRNNVQSID